MSDPTVVLVHGAFADASGFAGIIRELESAGVTVVAPPNPLRSVASDAAAAPLLPWRMAVRMRASSSAMPNGLVT